MNPRVALVMTIAVVCGFAIILLMNLAALVGIIPSRFISPNDVRGSAIEHKGLVYTLNFNQQNKLIEVLNRAVPISKKDFETRESKSAPTIPIQKIVIYRFNASDIEIKPVGYVSKSNPTGKDTTPYSMVLSIPEWNPQGFIEESVTDELHQLLMTTFDP